MTNGTYLDEKEVMIADSPDNRASESFKEFIYPISLRLRVIEQLVHGRFDHEFWKQRLKLKTQWHNWRNNKGLSGAVEREADIAEVLSEFGYESTPGFLSDPTILHEEMFLTRFTKSNIPAGLKSYSELPILGQTAPEIFRPTLLKLAPYGRSDDTPLAAVLTGRPVANVNLVLAEWLNNPEFAPEIQYIHIDVRRECYRDSSNVIRQIVSQLGVGDRVFVQGDDMIAAIAEEAVHRRFLLILQNIDAYPGQLLNSHGEDLRIFDNQILYVLYRCFAFNRNIKARLILTSRIPLHPKNSHPIIDMPFYKDMSPPAPETDNHPLIREEEEQALRNMREKYSIAKMINNYGPDEDVKTGSLTILPNRGWRKGDTKKYPDIAKDLQAMTEEARVLLRLIASSLDGTRMSLIEELHWCLNKSTQLRFRSMCGHNSMHSDDEQLDVDRLPQLIERIRGLVVERTEVSASGIEEQKFEILSETLRCEILKHWEAESPDEARRVYCKVAQLALNASVSEHNAHIQRQTRPPQETAMDNELRSIERMIQSAKAFLAGADPNDSRPHSLFKIELQKRTQSTPNGKAVIEQKLYITTKDFMDALDGIFSTKGNVAECREFPISTSDIIAIVYNRLWQFELEGRRRGTRSTYFRLIHKYGMYEARFGLLMSFISIGTAVPLRSLDDADGKDETSESVQETVKKALQDRLAFLLDRRFLTPEDVSGLTIGLAVSAMQTGRLTIAQAAADLQRSLPFNQNFRAKCQSSKIFVDVLIQVGKLTKARSVCEGFLTSSLKMPLRIGDYGSVDIRILSNPAGAEELPEKETIYDRKRAAVDFLCRMGRIFSISGNCRVSENLFKRAEEFNSEIAAYLAATKESVIGKQYAQQSAPMLNSNGRRYIQYLINRSSRTYRHYADNELSELRSLTWSWIEACHNEAKFNASEHDLACLLIDEARIHRLWFSDVAVADQKVREAIVQTMKYGVSKISHLEAMAEQARVSYHLGHDESGRLVNQERVDQARDVAITLKRLANSINAPLIIAEALLLNAEINEQNRGPLLKKFDDICQSHQIRFFDHPRALVVHGQSAILNKAW